MLRFGFHIALSKSQNKAQWSGTWSTILFYLTGRLTSQLEPVVSAAIFLSVRVDFWSIHGPCVKTREVRYVAVKGSKSTSGRFTLVNRRGCQSQRMSKWYGYAIPRESGFVKS
jgi:hypothetical protein